MEAIEGLRRTIHVTRELQSLVKTMKIMAGLNIRQYERAARSVAEYNRTVEMGLQIALRNAAEPPMAAKAAPGRKMGAIVFGSDQGMCGQLNDVIVDHTSRALARLARRRTEQTILAVGQRVAAQLEDRGRPVTAKLEVPGSIGGVANTVHELLRRIEEWRSKDRIELVTLFNCRLTSGVFYKPRGVRVLPVDAAWIRGLRARPWPSKVIPTYMMESGRLYHSLIREYLFVSLFRALAESLASENAARLASMQVAERNIEDRLKELTSQFHQSRQAAITSELLDIISGFEALKGKL
ncbi:MAG: F0F1 ATP synthase subunit gamma [Bryobacterales bacterium]|nr:F0F1 ATP synthase subunit gamma [Bryobacterales bacterium]